MACFFTSFANTLTSIYAKQPIPRIAYSSLRALAVWRILRLGSGQALRLGSGQVYLLALGTTRNQQKNQQITTFRLYRLAAFVGFSLVEHSFCSLYLARGIILEEKQRNPEN
jgi:hypothetical protein